MAEGFGVHLGNHSMCISLVTAEGTTKVLADENGDRITPAVAALNGSEWEVGLTAKNDRSNKKSTIVSNKRLLNDGWDEIDLKAATMISTCKIVCNDKQLTYEFESYDHKASASPIGVAHKFYSKLASVASHSVKAKALDAVIAVPLSFTYDSILKLIKCAEDAGFNIVHVLKEPVAAMCSYDLDTFDEDLSVLVVRIGGFTSDMTILKLTDSLISVKCTSSLPFGGSTLTHSLALHIAKEFNNKYKIDPTESRKAMMKVFNYADQCKQVLSTLESAQILIESLYEGVDWSQTITRARFENIIMSQIPSYINPLSELLDQYNDKIDKVILCGGTMKIPKFQKAVSDLLPNADILSSITPDEVIALGCSKELKNRYDLGIITKALEIEMEVLSEDVLIEYNKEILFILKKNTPVYTEECCILEKVNENEEIEIFLKNKDNGVISQNVFKPPSAKEIMLKAIIHPEHINLELVYSDELEL